MQRYFWIRFLDALIVIIASIEDYFGRYIGMAQYTFTFENKNFNKTISWLTYKGARIDQLDPPYNFQATHLVRYSRDNHKWWQPISIICLYEDLISAIDNYASLILKDTNLLLGFQQTANALTDPEETQLTWW